MECVLHGLRGCLSPLCRPTIHDPDYVIPFRIKVGREVLDPLDRVVTIVDVTDDTATVRLHGPRGTTIRYPRSVLRPVPPEFSR